MSLIGVDAATANEWAGELNDELRDVVPQATVTRQRSDPLNQDFGITLGIILGSASVTALAKGVQSWLAKRHEAKLRLSRTAADGSQKEIELGGNPTARTQDIIERLFPRVSAA